MLAVTVACIQIILFSVSIFSQKMCNDFSMHAAVQDDVIHSIIAHFIEQPV